MRIDDLPADRADDAIALWHAAGLTRPWNDPHADLMRALAGPTSTVLAAQADDGSLLGTAMVGHDGHRGWVYYLAVQAAVRRIGLGSQLMHASEQWLRERGVPKINLMVRTTNTAVIAFYESLGYEDGAVVGARKVPRRVAAGRGRRVCRTPIAGVLSCAAKAMRGALPSRESCVLHSWASRLSGCIPKRYH